MERKKISIEFVDGGYKVRIKLQSHYGTSFGNKGDSFTASNGMRLVSISHPAIGSACNGDEIECVYMQGVGNDCTVVACKKCMENSKELVNF